MYVRAYVCNVCNFLGLRPLAGYASLKLYHGMSCFCMRNVSCAMIWLVRLCMLPTPAPDDAGDASFLGPSPAPTQKADMGSHARAPEAPETAAQKEQPTSQPGDANATKHCRAGRPEHQQQKSKDCAAREPATAKAKRTEQQPTAQHSSFWRYLQRFVERGPSIAGMPGSAWRQNARNEPRLYPSDTF